MTLKLAQFRDDPKKYPQNLQTPKILIFLKNQKNIEIQNFEPEKIARAYVCVKISEYPPAPLGGKALPQKQSRQNLINVLHTCVSIMLKCISMHNVIKIYHRVQAL